MEYRAITCILIYYSAIHLSNQSVQKNFENSRTRSRMLPENNMWTSEEFQQYLKKRGCGNVWEDVVYPGMKKAVIATMESCQEVLEPRKVGHSNQPKLFPLLCTVTPMLNLSHLGDSGCLEAL